MLKSIVRLVKYILLLSVVRRAFLARAEAATKTGWDKEGSHISMMWHRRPGWLDLALLRLEGFKEVRAGWTFTSHWDEKRTMMVLFMKQRPAFWLEEVHFLLPETSERWVQGIAELRLAAEHRYATRQEEARLLQKQIDGSFQVAGSAEGEIQQRKDDAARRKIRDLTHTSLEDGEYRYDVGQLKDRLQKGERRTILSQGEVRLATITEETRGDLGQQPIHMERRLIYFNKKFFLLNVTQVDEARTLIQWATDSVAQFSAAELEAML